MGTPLGPKYIPYAYMDPLGITQGFPPGPTTGPPRRLKNIPRAPMVGGPVRSISYPSHRGNSNSSTGFGSVYRY